MAGPLAERPSGPADETAATGLFRRIAARPRPAAIWTGVAALLVLLEAGALSTYLLQVTADLAAALGVDTVGWAARELAAVTAEMPTLLSRETIPNEGHWNGTRYVGTFLGLPPHVAWSIRAGLVYAYALALVAWGWVGYVWYRDRYRLADWTPRDDTVDALRTHTWGLFGLAVVFAFLVMAVFAPTLGPTTVEQNLANPYGHSITYWTGSGTAEVTVGAANSGSGSRGTPQTNVGPWSYDEFGRFHPFGTLPSGKDLFTFLVHGARISLLVGLLAVGLSATIATALALVSSLYRGRVDDGTVLLADSVMAMPQLLLIIMLTVVLAGTWIGKLYSGAFVLALIFAGTAWPNIWRSIRGPALQVSERAWVDAAWAFGQRPQTIMRKHVFPYILGYLLVYGSMTLGGAIISISALSFLGLGVNPPTPEWGRAVSAGQDYVTTPSWHVSFIPGVLITLVVTGFNALGDGIRDAVDPQSDAAEGTAAGRGGGG